MVSRRGVVLGTPALALAGISGAVAQSGWKPTSNVEIIVGAGPGGENDRFGRSLQRAFTEEELVPNMTVVNRPGAGQTVAMNYLGSKRGDPHFIAVASGSFINTIARSGSRIHHERIEPLVRMFDSYQCYFVRKNSPIKSAKDVLDLLKENPTSVTFSFSVGLGSPLHISVANYAKLAGVDPRQIKTVVFDSGTEVAAQLAGGHVDITISSPGSGMGLVQAGHTRFLGVAAPQRLPGVMADVPTMREQGVDLITTTSYQLMIPRGLTADQIGFWKGAMARVLENANFKEALDRNFWTINPVWHPDAQAAFDAEYTAVRATLVELGFAR